MNHIERSKSVPKILIADDDPCVLRAVADRCARMGFEVEIARKSIQVIVTTGHPGQEIAERCEGLGASCIQKGRNFWNEFEARLIEIYPLKEYAIRQSGQVSAIIEVKKHPRVLLVDDDVSVKKAFFRKFENLGAELLYAADGMRGFWMARREEPTVIVADYCMPNGDAEYLLTRLRSVPETMGIPVIVQSGRRLNDATRQRLRQDIGGQPGATRILRKSFESRELFEALQRLCGFASDLEGELLYQ